ncbi:ATP-binding cassette domain-containing protein [Streptomyces sp. NPDC049916]|uniref:ATP-binding cassette domain-containing protein n=1 Tax=Streptomyces sp. NPDC049916 TaxID=3155156 RepID=UPI0034276F57
MAGTAVPAIRIGSASLVSMVGQFTELYGESLLVADYERLCTEAAVRTIPSGGMDLPERVGEVRSENVPFTYPASKGESPEPILRDVSLTFPMGKIITPLGENGSGKSTLIELLSGLYLPAEGKGTIWFGTIDAARTDRARICRPVALMSQAFYQWPFTLRVNVGIGRHEEGVDDDAVRAVAASSGADTVLAKLPNGLRTLLARGYRRGHQISGGRWQRVGIARARYRQGKILIVDEPTSTLDAVAEQKAFDQIRALAATGRTVVLITHRLHSVQHADLIHGLEDGQVAESGTFEELMHSDTGNGTFRKPYLLQSKAYDVPAQRAVGSPAETG